MSDEAYAEIADLRNRLGDAESQNQALQERIKELERVLANLGVRLNAGSSGDPAGGEVE
jgi:predicted nuclease with TOPRIM domain